MREANFRGKCQNFRILASMVAALAIILTGCEAKLDLSKVDEAEKSSIARYDHYLDAAKSDTTTVVIGNRGTILSSINNGVNWKRNALPGDTSTSYPTLVDIETCGDSQFVALDADRKIWIAGAKATGWISKAITTEEEVLDLTCDAKGNIWVVGSFTLILKSEDGGDSWQDQSIQEDAMFSKIQFVNNETAFITGEFGTVYKTSNGGETWNFQNPIASEFYPMASHFASVDSTTQWD